LCCNIGSISQQMKQHVPYATYTMEIAVYDTGVMQVRESSDHIAYLSRISEVGNTCHQLGKTIY
jgi:hypothetical protein